MVIAWRRLQYDRSFLSFGITSLLLKLKRISFPKRKHLNHQHGKFPFHYSLEERSQHETTWRSTLYFLGCLWVILLLRSINYLWDAVLDLEFEWEQWLVNCQFFAGLPLSYPTSGIYKLFVGRYAGFGIWMGAMTV